MSDTQVIKGQRIIDGTTKLYTMWGKYINNVRVKPDYPLSGRMPPMKMLFATKLITFYFKFPAAGLFAQCQIFLKISSRHETIIELRY